MGVDDRPNAHLECFHARCSYVVSRCCHVGDDWVAEVTWGKWQSINAHSSYIGRDDYSPLMYRIPDVSWRDAVDLLTTGKLDNYLLQAGHAPFDWGPWSHPSIIGEDLDASRTECLTD